MQKNRARVWGVPCLVALCGVGLGIAGERAAAEPVGPAFVYQGQLAASGDAYSGPADFRVRPYNKITDGLLVGPEVLVSATVVDGVFTLDLDFGPLVFLGDDVWLEIDVRTPGDGGTYTTLSPRQRVGAGAVREVRAGGQRGACWSGRAARTGRAPR